MNKKAMLKSLESKKYVIVDRHPPEFPNQKCNIHVECQIGTETGEFQVSRFCFHCGKEIYFTDDALREAMAAVGFSENTQDQATANPKL